MDKRLTRGLFLVNNYQWVIKELLKEGLTLDRNNNVVSIRRRK